MNSTTLTGRREHRIDPEDWPGAIAAADGPQIVVGGPGTGKTEFLVQRLLHLSREVEVDQILVLSFGRRGVGDLSDRVRHELKRSVGRLDITTFHSFAGRLLERHHLARGWSQPPVVLTGPEHVALVSDLLATEDGGRWSPAFRGLLRSTTFAAEVADFLLRARDHLTDAAALAASRRDDWRGLPQFFTRYDLALRRRNRIDYGTLLTEAVAALQIEDVAQEVAGSYRYVLIDEYQDTTPAQTAMIEPLVSAHRNLTVAADPYQSIYSFRGADLTSVAEFPRRFRTAEGAPGARLVLTTSFRVPAAVLSASVRVTSGELPGAAGPVVPAPGHGRVDVYHFDQETEEAEWVAGEIQRLHLSGTRLDDMAVFVRSKRRFVSDVSRALERRGLAHDTPDGRLVDQPAVRFLFDLVVAAIAESPHETAQAVRRLLLGPLVRCSLGVLYDIERTAVSGEHGWVSAIRAHLPEASAIAELVADPRWACDVPASIGFWEVWSSLPQLRPLVEDPGRRDERAAWASLSQVLQRWNERNPNATLDEYRRLSEAEEFEASPLLRYQGSGADRLTITTLHQSKGLQFEVVFIADAVEGIFPDLRRRDSLLGVRHIQTNVPDDAAAYARFRLQEERRLAYTAMTRARRRVVWTTTTAGGRAELAVPSRFLAAIADPATTATTPTRPPAAGPPVTPEEAEAWLRRMLVDARVSGPRRLAAARLLLDGEKWGLRAPDAFAGARIPGANRGLLGRRLIMSPSQAQQYEQCPRRYALERRLGVGSQTSVYAEFGRMIHEVLETTERAAQTLGEAHASSAAAQTELNVRFDPAAFGGGPFAAAWKARALETLDRLYTKWPTQARAVALERRLTMELHGTTWRGYADRIESDGIGLSVVDYKTTRTPLPQSDAAASLQLGFYLLAAAADPELAATGTPEVAEFWYPAKTSARALTRRSFDIDELPAVRTRLVQAAEGIRSEDWTPRPGPECDRCAVRSVCPVRPEGRVAFA